MRMARRSRFRVAGLGNRIIAWIIDYILTGICMCICCPVGCLYALCKDGIRDGRSIGKGMMGLRVVKADTGSGAGYGASIVRNCTPCCTAGICGCFSCFILAYPWGYLLCLFNDERQRLGDKLAGTVVIESK